MKKIKPKGSNISLPFYPQSYQIKVDVMRLEILFDKFRGTFLRFFLEMEKKKKRWEARISWILAMKEV